MKKNKIINFIWILAALLEWGSVVLYFAAMGDPRIPFDWYQAILRYPYRVNVFYLVSGVALILFAILVKFNQKKQNLKEMLIALMCFTALILMLIWKIKL